MHKVTSSVRYDLNTMVYIMTFDNRIVVNFRLSKSWWFGTYFHVNIYFNFSLCLYKPDCFTKGF